MKTIVLTGMMGCGKSTVGKILADKLAAEHLEIDAIIETQENSKISEIFKIKGEAYFRQLEQKIIAENFKPENQIISLGGGAYENPQTREFLLKNSNVFYLKTSPQVIFDRIKNDTTRPLLCDNMTVENITNILIKREKNYQSATYTIDTDNKNLEQIVNEIVGVL